MTCSASEVWVPASMRCLENFSPSLGEGSCGESRAHGRGGSGGVSLEKLGITHVLSGSQSIVSDGHSRA